jgi:hypothetical protein
LDGHFGWCRTSHLHSGEFSTVIFMLLDGHYNIQIPLLHGWATSITESRGMTFDRLKVEPTCTD